MTQNTAAGPRARWRGQGTWLRTAEPARRAGFAEPADAADTTAPSVSLICAPHAGGGAASYGPWRALLPPSVALHAVQLPGREDRFGEPPTTDLDQAADAVLPDILALPAQRPIVLFGHSMGGLLAYALARRLQDRGRPAAHVVISACLPGTEYMPRPAIAGLPAAQFVAELARFGGMPEEFTEHPGLLDAFLPTLRADLRMTETYTPEASISTPLTVFAGASDDTAPRDALVHWHRLTASKFDVRVFPGSHFYLENQSDSVVAAIFQIIEGLGR